jgi:phasin
MNESFNLKEATDQDRPSYRDLTAQLGLIGLDTAIPEGVRALAEKFAAQNRDTYDRCLDAFDTSVATFERSFEAAGQSATTFNRKIADIARRNVDVTFDLATSLAGVKHLADMVRLQADFWRKQFGVLAAQAEEVHALSTKVTTAAAEPIKSQTARDVDRRAQ